MADASPQLVPEFAVNEGESSFYSCSLVDEAGSPIGVGVIETLTLTLYNVHTAAIINTRSQQNVLGANQVTVSAGGVLSWGILPADNPVINTGAKSERHRAVFKWTWSSGAKSGINQFDIVVHRVSR